MAMQSCRGRGAPGNRAAALLDRWQTQRNPVRSLTELQGIGQEAGEETSTWRRSARQTRGFKFKMRSVWEDLPARGNTPRRRERHPDSDRRQNQAFASGFFITSIYSPSCEECSDVEELLRGCITISDPGSKPAR